jgi:hypothetical protein
MAIDEQIDGDLDLKSPNKEKSTSEFVDLGITPLAKQLGLAPEQTNGHWCSRCQGIWFGYTLEAECPVCGNRHG